MLPSASLPYNISLLRHFISEMYRPNNWYFTPALARPCSWLVEELWHSAPPMHDVLCSTRLSKATQSDYRLFQIQTRLELPILGLGATSDLGTTSFDCAGLPFDKNWFSQHSMSFWLHPDAWLCYSELVESVSVCGEAITKSTFCNLQDGMSKMRFNGGLLD